MLNACNVDLDATKKELSLEQYGVKLRDDNNAALQKQNDALTSKSVAWYENKTLWLAAGIFLGAYAARK